MWIYLTQIFTGLLIIYIGYLPMYFMQGKSDLWMESEKAKQFRNTKRAKFNLYCGVIIMLFGSLFVIIALLRFFGVLQPLPVF